MAEIALARLPYVGPSQALSIGRDVLLQLSAAGVAHGAVSAWTVMVTDTGAAYLIGNLPGAHDPAADARAAASLIASMTAEADPAVRAVLAAGASGQYPDARSLLAALDGAAQSRHGAPWWTSAGLGAAVTAAVAGAASSQAAGGAAGAGAVPGLGAGTPAAVAKDPVLAGSTGPGGLGRGLIGRSARLPVRTWIIAAGTVVVVAGGVGAALVANSGNDKPAHHVAVAPTGAAPAHPSPAVPTSPSAAIPTAPVSTRPVLAGSTHAPPLVGLSGRWRGSYSGAAGSGTFTLDWVQTAEKLTGVIRISNPAATLTITGTVHGGRISFGTLGGTPITYAGAVHGNRMSGTYEAQGFAGTWNGGRA